MSFIVEESQKEKELRKKVEAAFGNDPDAPEPLKSRERKAKEKREAREKDYQQKQKTLEFKRDFLEWQKQTQARNRAERLKKEEERRKKQLEKETGSSKINYETISDKDRDPTAYKKAIGGIASFGKAAIGVGTQAVIAAAKRRKAKKEQERQQAAERSSEQQRERTQSAMKQSTRLLPGNLAGETSGQRARRDPNFKKREIEKRGGKVSEEFSCWREEFLYELKELREKKKKKDTGDYIVDVMKGKNKITIGPIVKEETLNEIKGLRKSISSAIKNPKLREKLRKGVQKAEIPLLALSFAANVAQSPQALVRSGHIEGPGMQLMGRMMSKRKEADRNLDSGRVSHPARNIKKKEKVTEAINKVELIKAIVQKLVDEKKRKNTLLTKGYIGESKYSKENLQCNKPKSDPVGDSETGKSHVVKACVGGSEKLIRFGQKGVKGSPKKEGESEAYANRRKRFKARHAKNIAKGKMSASWWSNSVKW